MREDSSYTSVDSLGAGAEEEPFGELVWRELQQEAARRLNVDPAAVKPCFARIAPVAEGSRNSTAFMYATELRRMGAAEAVAWTDLLRWNGVCKPPMSARELRNTFESAWRGSKKYGCRGLLAATWCIGRDKCDWYKRNVKGRRKCREEDFLDYGWPGLLKSSEFRVYMALVRLEKARGVGAGGVVIASTRDYAATGGLYRSQVMGSLEGLERRGLLLILERGEPRSKGLPGRACQVKRVVPILEPPIAEVNRRSESLCA